MVRYFSYALRGKGVLPAKSLVLISLLKKAGAVFPCQPKFNNDKGTLLFHTIKEITEEINECAVGFIKGEGVKGAEIKYLGNYLAKQ